MLVVELVETPACAGVTEGEPGVTEGVSVLTVRAGCKYKKLLKRSHFAGTL